MGKEYYYKHVRITVKGRGKQGAREAHMLIRLLGKVRQVDERARSLISS